MRLTRNFYPISILGTAASHDASDSRWLPNVGEIDTARPRPIDEQAKSGRIRLNAANTPTGTRHPDLHYGGEG
jgi:hypothetical protein